MIKTRNETICYNSIKIWIKIKDFYSSIQQVKRLLYLDTTVDAFYYEFCVYLFTLKIPDSFEKKYMVLSYDTLSY